MKKYSKRNSWRKIEKNIQDLWESENDFDIKDYKKKKWFGTFPYPYSNGPLHLGHAFTLLKVEYQARFKQLQGFNVLFPFGFHCTGMPIKVSADKLKEDLEGVQAQILLSSGISQSDIIKFTDPNHWIKVFPQMSIDTLKKLGLYVDWRRSFVTTEINPFYDSFVKWQFNKLKERNHLEYGLRPAIFSVKDGQTCMDHDRRSGEGVEPIKKILWNIPIAKYKLITTANNTPNNVKDILYNKNTKFILVNDEFIMTEWVLKNLSHQINTKYEITKNIEISEIIKLSEIIFNENKSVDINHGTFIPDKYCSIDDKSIYTKIEFWEPEKEVISRSGDVCIVANLEQWYIKYGNFEPLLNHIEKMKFKPKELIPGTKNLKNWPCTRQYGLGTKFMNSDLLIDSLSDSTFYTSYYTISRYLQSDIFGKEKDVPLKDVTDNFWDSLIYNKPDFKYPDIQNEFNYWMPVDMRISGKDLLNSHLPMWLYNHMFVYPDDNKNYPQGCITNGWILVNNKKMSKQEGNFITIEAAISQESFEVNNNIDGYTADSLRLTLADVGDTIDDNNFDTKTINANILKLDAESNAIFEIFESKYEILEMDTIDKIFMETVNNAINNSICGYNNYKYREVIKFGFHLMIELKDKYINRCNIMKKPINKKVLQYYINQFLLINYPIIPHFCEFIWRKLYNQPINSNTDIFNEPYIVDDVLVYKNELIDNLLISIRKFLQKHQDRKVITINVPNKEYPEWWNNIIELTSTLTDMKQIIQKLKDISDVKIHKKMISTAAEIIKGNKILTKNIEPILDTIEIFKPLIKNIFKIDTHIVENNNVFPFEYLIK